MGTQMSGRCGEVSRHSPFKFISAECKQWEADVECEGIRKPIVLLSALLSLAAHIPDFFMALLTTDKLRRTSRNKKAHTG
ncbi:hypothetical protein [Vibrio vulnificus]|uniref:hypothetical protein n=1 Tax=Vibrio vulnificus TaxID=672 RepID=UPI00034B5EA6|nr:hypothetical protein [Vibrio vulnificus]HDY8066726.1 hypothetical protein [Vibrio vulnificus]